MIPPSRRLLLLSAAVAVLCAPSARGQINITNNKPYSGRFVGDGEKHAFTVSLQEDDGKIHIQAYCRAARFYVSLFNKRGEYVSLSPINGKGFPQGSRGVTTHVMGDPEVECVPQRP